MCVGVEGGLMDRKLAKLGQTTSSTDAAEGIAAHLPSRANNHHRASIRGKPLPARMESVIKEQERQRTVVSCWQTLHASY